MLTEARRRDGEMHGGWRALWGSWIGSASKEQRGTQGAGAWRASRTPTQECRGAMGGSEHTSRWSDADRKERDF